MTDPRIYAPATQRNRDVILDVLRAALPSSGLVLEIASGSGEHAVHFAQALPRLTFQPTDPTPDALASIAAWIAETNVTNVRAPVLLDVTAQPWPVTAADAVLCINMIHISPWAATLGLMRGAASLLKSGAPLYTYGPYKRGGTHTAPSNANFDASLRARDPSWGVRDLEEVAAAARDAGFAAPEITPMPANNFSLVFRRT
jgi:SAM-dependent methyltransferase